MCARRYYFLAILIMIMVVATICDFNKSAIAQKGTEAEVQKSGLKELPPEMVGEQANELLHSINDAIASRLRYEEELKGASKEDRQVLQLQINRMGEQIINDIHLLPDILLKLEKKGSQAKLRKEVERVFGEVSPRLWHHIEQLNKEIDRIRAKRSEAKPEERAVIEAEIGRYTLLLDKDYKLSFDHIQKMEQIGMGTQETRARLTELLNRRVDKLSGRLELSLVRIDDLEKQLKTTPEDPDLTIRLIASKTNLANNAASLKASLDLMDKLKLDTDDYRTQLVSVTRDISSGLLDTSVAIGMVGQTFKKIKAWFAHSGPKYLVKLFIIIGILVIFRFITRIVRAGLEKVLDPSKVNLSELARRTIISWSSNLVMFFGIMVALSQFGISLGPLLAGLGVAGFIVGFALQDTLGNFAAGMMILIYRPYDVGDLVDVGGVFGTVEKMNVVSTSLLTVDNQLFVLPNSKIWGDVIKNVTAQDIRRVDMVFGISYSDDIPKSESILEEILKSHELVLDSPEPVVRLHTLGASSVDFVVRPWAKADDYWDVYWDVTRTVKMRFDEEGISIPFPQQDVHLYREKSLTSETE